MNRIQSLFSLTLARIVWRIFGFLRFILQRMLRDDRCLQVSGSLAFTSLLSLVPLFTLGLIVAAAFPGFEDYSARFKVFLLSNLVPDSAGRIITVYMRQFTDNTTRLTAVGLAFLAVSAFSLLFTIERVMNAIWRVRRPRPFSRQLLIYWTVLTVGPLMLGLGLSLSAALAAASRLNDGWGDVASGVRDGGGYLLTVFMLALVYRLVPNRFVPLSHAAIGAAVAAVLLVLAKAGFAGYVEFTRSYQLVYGAFAAFPLLLLWLQMVWLIILLGAELSAGCSYWRGNAWQREHESQRRFQDALEILLQLDQAQQHGQLLSMAQLRSSIRAGYDEIGQVLDHLEMAGFVSRTQNERWVLQRQASRIFLDEIFSLFVLPPYSDGEARSVPEQVLAQTLTPSFAALSEVSLAEFARRCGVDKRLPAAAG